MRNIFLIIMLLFGASEVFADDAVLNLVSPAATSALFPTLRILGPADNGANPPAKLPTLPCRANAAAPSWTEGSIVPCSVTLAGEIRMSGGGGGGGTSSTFGAAFPATGTASGFSDGTNMQGGRVHDLDTGGGTEYNVGVNLRFSAGGASVEAGVLANPLRVDPTGTTTQPISAATLPLPTGAATEATLATRLADATFTGRFAAAFLSADAIANQTTTATHGFGYFFNGATWDRMRGTIAGGLLVDVSDAFLLDTTFTGRFPAGSTPADNESNAVTITRIGNFNFLFDGATWDRAPGNSTDGQLVNLGANNDVVGTKTNNSAAPGGNNLGTLPCIANAADPTWTEGNQVGCSTTLAGAERVEARQPTAANLNNRPDTSGATGAAPPARADFIGGLSSGATGGLTQGISVCDTPVTINVSTATTTLLVTGVSGRHVRICTMNVVTTLANGVALISGTGATCGTGTTGMNGGTTGATGWQFAANGGLTQGSGVGTINQTNATGDSVCIVTSVATQLSGRMMVAIY